MAARFPAEVYFRKLLVVLLGWTAATACVVRRSNNCFGDRCFAAAGPRVWNMLPIHLRLCDSLGQFERLPKTNLFGV